MVIYQAVVGAVAHVWWSRAIQVVGPSRAAVFMNVQPVIGLVLAALALREEIGFWQLAGGACVLAGVVLTTQGRRANGSRGIAERRGGVVRSNSD